MHSRSDTVGASCGVDTNNELPLQDILGPWCIQSCIYIAAQKRQNTAQHTNRTDPNNVVYATRDGTYGIEHRRVWVASEEAERSLIGFIPWQGVLCDAILTPQKPICADIQTIAVGDAIEIWLTGKATAISYTN